jgi:glycosyltransferase involved in cell wall biosynthesis
VKNKKHILVSVTNDLVTDNRVDRICTFLHENGFEVSLIGRKLPTSLPLEKRSYQTKRMRLFFTKGALFYMEFNLRLFIVLLTKKSTHLLANDLDTLLANYVASKLKRNRLYYDTHEYFTEVPELVNRPRVKAIWEMIEGYIFPKLKTVYTVNQSIASRYAEKYKKDIHVVRNIAKQWKPSENRTKKELGIPEGKKLFIVQGAGINVDRGIEEAIEAMKYTIGICLLIVGDGDVVPQLKKYIEEHLLTEKVLFFNKRPYHELMHFTQHADFGLTLDKDTNLNYRFSLPNKVFDYIQATTPILASDLPEIRNIIDKYGVGTFIPSHTPIELGEFFMRVVSNTLQHEEWKKNCQLAAQQLTWENEQNVLKKLYEIN